LRLVPTLRPVTVVVTVAGPNPNGTSLIRPRYAADVQLTNVA